MTGPEDAITAIGVDLGGTKIEAIALGADGTRSDALRVPAPQGSYEATIRAIVGVVEALDPRLGSTVPVGLGMPGSLAPRSGLVQNANSTWLNGRPLARDLATALGRPLKAANDANCFALSEATDGAGADAAGSLGVVLGVILGTGCGGGVVVDGRIVDGPRGTGGEWGHNPLPWAGPTEHPGSLCWCGRHGCMETWVSGPGLARDHARETGRTLDAEAVVAEAAAGEPAARATLARHASRLARGLAQVVNVIDPDVVVLGGGLSKLAHLYEVLPGLMAPHIFAEDRTVLVRPPRWGDASGVRGAAWLWAPERPSRRRSIRTSGERWA